MRNFNYFLKMHGKLYQKVKLEALGYVPTLK